MPARIKFSEEQKQQIIEAYKRAASVEEMTRIAGCTIGTYLRYLKQWGVVVDPKRRPKVNLKRRVRWESDAAIEEFRTGRFTQTEIAERYGVSQQTVKRELLRRGVVGQSRGEFLKNYFEDESRVPSRYLPPKRFRKETNHTAFSRLRDDPVAQFWAGLIATDGCILSPTTCRERRGKQIRYTYRAVDLALHVQDEATVRRFAAHVGGPVYKPKKANVFRCRVQSEQIVCDLESVGIVPRKTLSMRCADWLVESPHFLRGVICGDGCVRWGKVGRQVYPILTLVGAAFEFMTQVRNVLAAMVPTATLNLRTTSAQERSKYAANIEGRERFKSHSDIYSLGSCGWSTGALLIEKLFVDVPTGATLDRKQVVADEIIAALIERRRLGDEREWDRLNAEEWSDDSPEFYGVY